ncbi:hypothetical protein GGF32_000251 [Allomyces javanicus]|nr:hypothetical protein GGF32_000251 [Allomyces javanicus]
MPSRASSPSRPQPALTTFEQLPEIVLEALCEFIHGFNDECSVLRFALVSPAFYASAMRIVIRFADHENSCKDVDWDDDEVDDGGSWGAYIIEQRSCHGAVYGGRQIYLTLPPRTDARVPVDFSRAEIRNGVLIVNASRKWSRFVDDGDWGDNDSDGSDAEDDDMNAPLEDDEETQFPIKVLARLPMATVLSVEIPVWTSAMLARIKHSDQLQHLKLLSFSKKSAIDAATLGPRLPESLVSLNISQPIAPADLAMHLLPRLPSSLRSLALNLSLGLPAPIAWPAHLLQLRLNRSVFVPLPLPPKLQFLALNEAMLHDHELGSWMREFDFMASDGCCM